MAGDGQWGRAAQGWLGRLQGLFRPPGRLTFDSDPPKRILTLWAALRSPVAARRGLCSPKKDKQRPARRSKAGAPQATRRFAPPVARCPARFPANGGPVLGATKGQQEGANPFFCLFILWARIEKKLAQTGATV